MKVFRSSKSTQRSFKLFSIINSQGIEQTTTELFILKFLWCSNNLMQKSKTPSIHEIIHLKLFFKNFAQEIITIFKVIDNPTKGPVYLDVFRPFASEVP